MAAHPLHLAADPAIALLTLGVLLMYIELNRPGIILPGAVGLILSLLAISNLLHVSPTHSGLFLLAAAIVLPLFALRFDRFNLPIASTFLFIFGLYSLIPAPRSPGVHIAISVICGLILGIVSTYLAQIARRARTNKGLDLKRARTSRPGASKS